MIASETDKQYEYVFAPQRDYRRIVRSVVDTNDSRCTYCLTVIYNIPK